MLKKGQVCFPGLQRLGYGAMVSNNRRRDSTWTLGRTSWWLELSSHEIGCVEGWWSLLLWRFLKQRLDGHLSGVLWWSSCMAGGWTGWPLWSLPTRRFCDSMCEYHSWTLLTSLSLQVSLFCYWSAGLNQAIPSNIPADPYVRAVACLLLWQHCPFRHALLSDLHACENV